MAGLTENGRHCAGGESMPLDFPIKRASENNSSSGTDNHACPTGTNIAGRSIHLTVHASFWRRAPGSVRLNGSPTAAIDDKEANGVDVHRLRSTDQYIEIERHGYRQNAPYFAQTQRRRIDGIFAVRRL
jgi:hypothetical protein